MRRWLVSFGTLLLALPAQAYRPFDSTDADVADAGELETELGYFTVAHFRGEDTYLIPKVVLNYGITDTLEIIGEFDVEKARGRSAEIVDAALLLKGMLRRGVLQDEQGLSVAFEAGLLVPSADGDRSGFEGIGIVSGELAGVTYHLNFGGGIDTADTARFVVWGAILERPLNRGLRLVGEINGEKVKGEPDQRSALLGFIWESASPGDAFDGGIRWGISDTAPDWELTLGWTFSFPRR